MARLKENRFNTGAIEINYAEGPDSGPPLVLLHGLAARWQLFMPLIPALSQEWHIYAPDFRGHGTSGRQDGHYVLEDYMADTVAFLRGIVRQPAVLYGHSLGGWVAMEIAGAYPDLVRGIVVGDSALYDSAVDPDMAVSYLANMPMAMRGLSKSLVQLDNGVMDALHTGALTANFRPDELYPRVTCPVLLLQADPREGGLMTDEDVEKALPLFPDARHSKFPGFGHGLHIQDAAAVRDVVEPFLQPFRQSA
jgi:pimeloyl-ACP methyl ester carboxylesterase